ncbi:hypothetical protein J8F10_16520 [Gemmata sp. G18]|uniref:VWA domain-containing protein n=1 Tax=Gemmata palustris TaxID=2822762 RepID=A0ABS5BTX5_9BACT|nr:hypothetical protein [Gemmata palustris]MBP3956877.1 hypothetical protein [Gemmata palustris]
MDPNEMLKLLDLGAKPARAPTGPEPRAVDAAGLGNSLHPTALEVDAWGLRRGRDLVAESDRLRRTGADALGAADFFAAAFDPDPRLRDGCADARRYRFLEALLGTPEYRALHAATRLDDTASALAAGHFAEQFAALPAPGTPGAHGAAGPSTEPEGATLRAASKALVGAVREVTELKETAAALGLGPGAPGSNDPRAIAELFRRVRDDPGLRAICALAGRFRRVARARQRARTGPGFDDTVGVEPGGDVGRLLPSELVKLVIPELELDALRRVTERQSLCRAHRSVEPVGRGPIVVVVDESGSMEGAKVHAAKALALALAWVARHQRRWCALVAYSGASGERLLGLPPGRWDGGALCDWLGAFIGRGSDLDLPLEELPRMYRDLGAPPGATDLVLVTDARVRIPADLRTRFGAWRRAARVRALGLVVGSAPGDLGAACDEVHVVPALDPTGPAVGRVLALGP